MEAEEPQQGQAGSGAKASRRELPASTSTTKRRDWFRRPSKTAMLSEAIHEPMTPQVAPKTPASAHVGTEEASGMTG